MFSVCGEFVADYFFAEPCTAAAASGVQAAQLPEHPGSDAQSSSLFAGLLNGAFDTQFAHVFVGGNFGVDVVSLENQGERHGQDEKSDGQNRQKNYD